MKRFKVPLIATAIVFAAMVIIGIASISLIYSSSGSSRKKAERASMAGAGVATLGCIAIAPFWLYTAAKIGQERRRNKS
jgi:NADH:ubiquinone oxidoreductase subunit 4 (subunit M)